MDIFQIIWERADLIYPLAVGAHIFSPDARLTLHFPQSNISQLIISNATVEDAKIYRCRSTIQKLTPCVNDTCVEQNEAFELTFNVIYGKPPPTRMQAIESSGPALAFYGMPIEFICRATFSSPEAKRDPTTSLEWYHNGVRRRPSRSESGGTYITSRWIDSNLLESRLLITWTSEKEIGRWNCVERSQMNKRKLMNETGSTPLMSFDQLNLEIIAPPPISAFATTTTFGSLEAIHPKSPKFRRYLQLKESSGGWRKTSFGSFSIRLACSTFVPLISVLLNFLILH
ncbi:unnamed protein product [Hymenolepis diminuta]|uniref:Ig-like domain-containing protein n=1 Tax=Hymenolepis diminuta TaxID=6216 RepID=A0A564Z8A3_HYMDI|nr:unnamed protein product [Hymenolepis diminuta]